LSSNKNNEIIPPFNDEEKNDLVLKHQKIVIYSANKFRFLDPDFEELKGWSYLGLAEAIRHFEEHREEDFATIAFKKIRNEIIKHYSKKNNRYLQQRSISLQSKNNNAEDDGDELTLEGTIADDNSIFIEEEDIKKMIEEAFFEEPVNYKKINTDWLLSQKELNDISKEYKVTLVNIRKILRRGQALIKNYLVNNDIILDCLSNPSEVRKKEEKIINHKIVSPEDLGKIKYIIKNFPDLGVNDIAMIINTSAYMVFKLLEYPTASYVRASPDETIREKTMRYCKRKYPERLPGKVIIHNDVNKIMA
jgi:RNA polymerase sigma factor (sigma-70 family)